MVQATAQTTDVNFHIVACIRRHGKHAMHAIVLLRLACPVSCVILIPKLLFRTMNGCRYLLLHIPALLSSLVLQGWQG